MLTLKQLRDDKEFAISRLADLLNMLGELGK